MILLIQFRTDQSGWHEIKCVFDAANIAFNSFNIFNAASEINTQDDLRYMIGKADKVLIGGLGETGYEETDPHKKAEFQKITKKVKPVLRELIEADNKPTLGFCFGHQLMADALGFEVKADKAQAETGIVDITLTQEGQADPLFAGMSSTFGAIEGHKSSIIKLPTGAVLLASSERCNIQSYRMGKNIYGTQFHAELSLKDLEDRLLLYPGYKENTVKLDPDFKLETGRILENFLGL